MKKIALNLPINQIIRDYENGMSAIKIAKKYGCSDGTIYNKLRKYGIKIRSHSESHTFNLPIDQIIIDYKNGMSTCKLGKKYECCDETIRVRLKKANIKLRSDLPIEQIIADYKNEMGIGKICEKYKSNNEIINRILKENNIPIRTFKEAMNIISTRICINCGHEFEGKPTKSLCPDCNSDKYCYKFNKTCKEQNREKYNRECFFCGIHEDNCDIKHAVHHSDYDKNQGCNDIPWRLIPLCNRCHGMTSGGSKESREMWKARIIWLLNNI